MTEPASDVRCASSTADKQAELELIVEQAIRRVLDRPEGRRGPFLLDEDRLRSVHASYA